MQKIRYFTVLTCAALIAGCATIVGQSTHLLPIASTPSDAAVVITDEKGAEIFKGTTPTQVTLAKSDGSYFGGKAYTVKISKDGFQTQSIPVESHVNGWYIGGNLVFGGLIGWLIVDPLNGGMYNLTPETIASTLSTTTAHNNMSRDGIAVMLLQDVPPELRGKMVRIN